MRFSKKREKFLKKQETLYVSMYGKKDDIQGRKNCGAKVINGLSINLSRNHYFSCDEENGW